MLGRQRVQFEQPSSAFGRWLAGVAWGVLKRYGHPELESERREHAEVAVELTAAKASIYHLYEDVERWKRATTDAEAARRETCRLLGYIWKRGDVDKSDFPRKEPTPQHCRYCHQVVGGGLEEGIPATHVLHNSDCPWSQIVEYARYAR